MKHKLVILLVFILFALGGTALADTVLTLTGAGGPTGNNLGGAYVAPYTGTLSPGVAPLGAGTLTLICDDFTHDVSLQQQWPVAVTQFSTSSGALINTRFGNGGYPLITNGVVLYEEMFYLVNKMSFPASPSPATLTQNADLNWAIWALSYQAETGTALSLSGLPASDQSAVNSDILSATNPLNYGSENYSNFYIITPTCTPREPCEAGTGQEYITKIPEPASLAIWAAGLSALLFRRKRF